MTVAYAPLDTSMGRLWMASSDAGVVRIALGSPGERSFIRELQRRNLASSAAAALIEDAAALRDLRRQLLEYSTDEGKRSRSRST